MSRSSGTSTAHPSTAGTIHTGSAGRFLPPEVARVFGDLHFRIDGELRALCYAPDGTAWSVEELGMLRHWDAATGEQRSEQPLSDLEMLWTFSPDARLVASGSDDLSLWETASGQLLWTLPQPFWVTALAFAPDMPQLATGHDDGRVRLWDFSVPRLITELVGHDQPLSALAFSPDGQRLAAASEDRTISLWDVPTGRLLGRLEGHTDRIAMLAWHPQGHRLVSAGWDTTVRVWDPHALKPVFILNGHADVVSAVTYHPAGHLLASADSQRVIWLWDPDTGQVLHRLHGHVDPINCLAFSPDGRRLLSGGEDRQLLLWDVTAGRNLLGITEEHVETARVSLHPDGKRLAYATGSEKVRVWDPATGKEVQVLTHPSPVDAVSYSPDGKWLATGDILGIIRIWDAETGQLARALELHRTAITALAFSPTAPILASAGGVDGYVYLWSLTRFEPILLIPEATGKHGTVETLAFCPGTNLLAVGGMDMASAAETDGVITLWDITTGRELTLPVGTLRLAVRPDGKQLAAVTRADEADSVCLWNLATQALVKELIGHEDTITCLAYSPDGQLLATGSEDGTIRLWRSDTGERVTVIDLDTPVRDLTFAPDGHRLYTANANTTCYAIEVSTSRRL